MRVWRAGDSVPALREALDRGGILAIPTESSYGLGADPWNQRGVQAIYDVKGRDARKALPVVAGDVAQLESLGIDPASADVEPFLALWPAALTVVARTSRSLPAAAGEGALAVRIPAHDGLRRLLRDLGRPLTATSANRAGAPPILDLAGLEPLLAATDATAIDGGTLPGGAPSTLVELRDGALRVLRSGRFPVNELRRVFSTATVEITVENAS